MNKGVEMIIARMESNPEEFVAENDYSIPPNKWSSVILSVKERMYAINGDAAATDPHYKYQLAYLADEEILAIWAKYQTLLADVFTKRVMQTLLSDPTKEDAVDTGRMGYGWASPVQGNYHEPTGNQGRDQSQLAKLQSAYMQHQLDAQKIQQTNILESLRKVENLRQTRAIK